MSSLRFLVLLGSERMGRQGLKVAQLAVHKLQQRGHTADLVDPEALHLPVLKVPYHYYGHPEWGAPTDPEPPPALTALAKSMEAADGFVVVDAEYNHCPTPGMLNLIDHFFTDQFAWKASGIVTYSMSSTAGARSGFVLRNLLGEVGLMTCSSIFSLSKVHEAFDSNTGKLTDASSDSRLDKFIAELVWYVEALQVQRQSKGLPGDRQQKPTNATQSECNKSDSNSQ